ncbi:MAG TPA: PEP-CTERM sorting domain-containing protein [Terriglobales bacterium]|nr:PEP-CTERM sorting domain-containing protein [Terriglobales bacterium]
MNVSGKAVAIVALAVLAFPLAALADNTSSDIITWFNTDATVSTAGGVLSLTTAITSVTLANNSTLTALPGSSLGSISLTSGALVPSSSVSFANGCLASSGGCSFSFAASSFTITSTSKGVPGWSGEVTPGTDVTLSGTCGHGECIYSVIASLSSSNGQVVGSTDLTFSTIGKFKGGSSITTSRAGGLTNITVPEPGTLGLLGVGLFCLAGVLRRKLVRS